MNEYTRPPSKASFGKLVDSGKTKDEICKIKNLSSEAYDKAYDSLMKIREEKRKEHESQAVEVTIEGRKGLYHMDMERKEFMSMVNPEDKIPFDTDEEILVTALTCPTCHALIERLEYKESGTYSLLECAHEPTKLDAMCPICHILIDKNLLKLMGVDWT